MGIVSVFFQWLGVAFGLGSLILIIIDNKKSMPTQEEKDFLINCGAISVDEKNKKVLRKATREYRTTQFVLSNLCLTKDEILDLSKQAQKRKLEQNTINLDKLSKTKTK